MAVQFQLVAEAPRASESARRRGALRKEHSKAASISRYGTANPPDHFCDVIDYLNTKHGDGFRGRFGGQGKLFISFRGIDIGMFMNGTYYTTGARTIISLRTLDQSSNSLGQIIGDEILKHETVKPIVGTIS